MSNETIPFQAIRLAAKTGFITKGLWKNYIATGSSKTWMYYSWRFMERRKYFQKHPDVRYQDVLILNTKSLRTRVALQLAEIGRPVSPPFSKNIRHDEILLSGILQLENQNLLDGWTSEAELKSLKPVYFRTNSDGDLPKYPDAVLRVLCPESFKMVAVELEMTAKSRQRYLQILANYMKMAGVDYVLFVVGNDSIRRTIQNCLKPYLHHKFVQNIGFMNVNSWTKSAAFESFQTLKGDQKFKNIGQNTVNAP